MKHKRKRPGKPAGMNYADVLKTRRDRLQLAMDEAAEWGEKYLTLDIDWDNVDFRNAKFPGAEKRTDKDEETKNMNTKRAAKLLKIANYYGQERQVCKLMEELGEATSAASEVLQLLTFSEDSGKESGLEERLEHLASELADVANVTEQILALFALEVEFKVARQRGVDKTIERIRKELGDEA